MDIWIQQVISKWKSEGVNLNPGASTFDIEKAESVLDFTFPEDFKELYQLMNGFSDFEWQEHMFSFWSLERIVKEYDEDHDKSFIGFCDFLICSHIIGYGRSERRVFKNYTTPGIHYTEDKPIALSFKDAVDMINGNAELIY